MNSKTVSVNFSIFCSIKIDWSNTLNGSLLTQDFEHDVSVTRKILVHQIIWIQMLTHYNK